MSQEWKVICSVDDIPVLGSRVIQRKDQPNVAVFRNTEDKVFALLDRCPHKGGPLSQGIVFGERVACPLHNWSIELQSGCAVAPDEGCTQSFRVKVEHGLVHLDLNELAMPAAPLTNTACAGEAAAA
ncbi:nitrite reductase small subunit NirD [Oxalicibacterium faecigallinarum]|uniref:Nitrite reductase small subunit n=1 Tax=Oxalicibacterium faecigallinarum TaxID=573741 RepID=A0A8J3AT28_9BURK|nr:nitrite reductase small subunit NirD [Oxalicibacterium faecigallinarum]GGI21491.1 nitrite reductase small subunit [Oxalicibacterium faecigallinarum]